MRQLNWLLGSGYTGNMRGENCFAVCRSMEGGSVISSDIKATRKLLEPSFYKSPSEKYLPCP